MANHKLPRNAVSSAGIISLGGVGNNNNNNINMNNNNMNMFGNSNPNMHNMVDQVELEGQGGGPGGGGASGIKNAIWGAPPATRKMGTNSLFSSLLSTTNHSLMTTEQNMSPRSVSTGSTPINKLPVTKQGLTTTTITNTSMQDLMWLSKTQTKTQALLRQSSAHSLLRQTSSQSLKDTSRKVDVSYLLPPHHASYSFWNNNNNQTMPPNSSNSNHIETTSLLHQSCRLYPTTAAVVESALRIDPDAVRRAVAVSSPAPKNHHHLHKPNKPHEIYAYPINIAIKHDATMEVVHMLVQAGPDVLTQADGTDGAGSLGIALHHKCSLEIVDTLVSANPSCAKVADRRANYPLHIAVASGLSLAIVKRLHMAYPKALEMRNFHSQTPLDMAQRSTRCPEPVMNYLQAAAFPTVDNDSGDYNRHDHHYHHHNDSGNNSVQADLEDALDDIMQTNL